MLTCYSPVRRSSTPKGLSARLACVKHAASVRPEPGSNSPTKIKWKIDPAIKEIAREINHLWHWLIKHPVEFSRNKHPPAARLHQEDFASGATPLLYPTGFTSSTGSRHLIQSRSVALLVPTRQHTPPGASGSGGNLQPGRSNHFSEVTRLQWRPARTLPAAIH